MLVKDIMKLVCELLLKDDLVELLNSSLNINDIQNNEDLKLILSCINLVNNTIATDYIDLKETKTLISKNNKISFNEITNKNILDIISIRNKFNSLMKFKINGDYIEILDGEYLITYAYIPNEVDFNGVIDCYKTHMSKRVFAYGVLSEYYFIKGNFDDARMWDIRFKDALLNITRKKNGINIPKRNWI